MLGDQAGTSSRIRNYLGFPTGVSGRDLGTRAVEQVWFFGVRFVLSKSATRISPAPGGYRVELDGGPGHRRQDRASGDRRDLAPAGRSGARDPARRRGLLWRRALRYRADRRRRRVHRRRRQFGGAGGGPSAADGGVRHAARPRRAARSEHVGLPGPRARANPQHPCPPSHRDRHRERARPPEEPYVAGQRAGRHRGGPGRRALRDDLGPSAHRPARANDRPRRAWFHPHGRGRDAPGRSSLAARRSADAARDQPARCVRRRRRPPWLGQRVASAVGSGSIAVALAHIRLAEMADGLA